MKHYFIVVIAIFLLIHPGLVVGENKERVLNLDEIDYFIYKGRKLTLSGLINAFIQERQSKYINELMKRIKRLPEWKE